MNDNPDSNKSTKQKSPTDKLQDISAGLNKIGNQAMGAGCAVFVIAFALIYFLGC